jgi:hypothetical protein
LLGGLLAAAIGDRMPRVRTYLVSIAFAMAWYYISFRVLWRSVMPLVALLHVERSTLFGHLIYGAVLGSFPGRLPKPEQPAAGAVEEPTPTPTQSSSPPDPASQSESS